MDRILEIQADDLDCHVQAGIRRVALNDELEKHGLWLPIDPGADASVGGMAATGASGTTTVRYGTIRENILGLTCVLADGRIIETGGRARKSSAGYDLTKLMLGSEGTLGVITDARLKLHPLPEAISVAACAFRSVEGCVDTVIEILQSGIPVARCELLDEVSVRAVNDYSKLAYEPTPLLFLEFHGTSSSVAEQASLSGEIAVEHGGGDFQWTIEREKREELWRARHHAYYAIKALRPGSHGWVSDICVPISKLVACLQETLSDIGEANLVAPILGHVGDGNFHAVFLVDPDDEEEMARARSVNDRMIERTLALGGTCTGEHGIGIGKIDVLRDQHGEGVNVMRAIKQALDPLGILNPGKILG
ncbi:MAG: FAD-binding protein [Bryobacterales bacterium]|nr:FAD-binding protein [Bryobacterales bacterium]